MTARRQRPVRMSRMSVWNTRHQYVDRRSSAVCTERLFADRAIAFIYDALWENAPAVFSLLTAAWSSRILGFLRYDSFLGSSSAGTAKALRACGVDLNECTEDPVNLCTARALFERQIR